MNTSTPIHSARCAQTDSDALPGGTHVPARAMKTCKPTRAAVAALGVMLVGTLVVGCADTRITLAELNTMQAEVATVEPVELETADLTLTELHPYTVGTDDILTITFTGLKEQYEQTLLTVRVHDDGTIMLPMVGRINVAGMDLKGIEKALFDAHVPKFIKDMSVFVDLGGSQVTTVVVVGPGGESGPVTLKRNERNVLYALSSMSGFGPTGNGRVHVRPARPDRPEVMYDLTEVNDLRRALLAPPLESGDMVVVEPAPTSAIYVSGLVNAPGPIPVPTNGNLSLVRTVAAAGGLRDFLEPREATLWRTLADGRQVRVKIALADVMAGKTHDVALLPGDVIDIPHTVETRAREWFAQNIRLGPFGVTSMYDPVSDHRARILRSGNDDSIFRRTLLQTFSTGVSNFLIPPVRIVP